MTNFNIQIKTNPIVYSKTALFLSSAYCKGNMGLNKKVLNQNNTGTYFENIIKNNLNNVVSLSKYKRIDGSTYTPDIETNKSVISCKVQETKGTAWQKLVLEALDLEYLTTQTNKKVVLLCSDYSWITYFYKVKPYLNKIIGKIEICTESYFLQNIKNYD